ncbi:MAG: hypothetical protein R6X07_16035 [Desulfatiglandales bacterium]
MFFIHLFYALFFALLLTAAFFALFRTKGPWSSIVLFFLVIFLASWAGGAWLTPFGPGLWGISFLPFLLVGLIFALLLAASAPSEREESTVELVDPEESRRKRATAATALGLFFWVLVGALLVIIIARYIALRA